MDTWFIIWCVVVGLYFAFLIIRELMAPLCRWLNDSLDRWLKWRDVRDTYQTRKLR